MNRFDFIKKRGGVLLLILLFVYACQDESTGPGDGGTDEGLATVLTREITNITESSAVSGGIIVNNGGSDITQYGVCWSENTPVTLEDNCTLEEGTAPREFTSNLTGLSAGTIYFVRAYATNESGTASGSRKNFETRRDLDDEETETVSHGYVSGVTPEQESRFIDRTYTTVQANWDGVGGDKLWTRMNLGATAEPTSPTDQSRASAGWYFQFHLEQGFFMDESERIPDEIWFNSISVNADWDESDDPCRLLLGGTWRLPTQDEWESFRVAPVEDGGMGGGTLEDAFNSDLKLHAAGLVRLSGTELDVSGIHGYYWSGDQRGNTEAHGLHFNSSFSSMVYGNKAYGLPVRCIQE